METLQELLEKDLTHLAAALGEEFAAHGRLEPARHRGRRVPRLLPRPVGAVLERAARRRAADPRHRVGQLHARRAGVARSRSRATRTSRSCEHDASQPAAARAAPTFEYIIHAAGIASPTYYRQFPIETMDANINGLRHLLDYARAPGRRGASPVEGFLFFSSSEIYGDPTAREHPDARGLPRQRVLHGAARLLRRVEALRRDAVRELRAAVRPPVTIARPFNNYGPGLKITDRRVHPRLRARRARGARHRHALRRLADADVLLRRGRGRRLLQGARPRPPRRAVQHRRRDAGDLDAASWPSGSPRSRRELFGYRGKVVRQASARAGLPRRQPHPPLPRHREGARPSSATTRRSASTRGCAARCSGTRDNRSAAEA